VSGLAGGIVIITDVHAPKNGRLVGMNIALLGAIGAKCGAGWEVRRGCGDVG